MLSTLSELKELQILDLSKNDIRALPSQMFLGNWSKLRILHLHRNMLTSVPPEIRHLKGLHTLYLNYNYLEVLTSEVGHLSLLKTLKINNNLLTEIPAQLGILFHLH